MSRRIGIYAGTFDPVHSGHITFALQAIEKAKLDVVYFMPERRPRDKQHVEHFAHRVAMLKRASLPHPQFKVLELTDINFSIERSLPKLERLFEGEKLIFLFGSDVAKGISDWPNCERLLSTYELVVGLRYYEKEASLKSIVDKWPFKLKKLTFINSYAPEVSSSKIRSALRNQRHIKGTLKSVESYSNRNWVYISLSSNY